MSGYVPRKVSNARMRTKTNQTGLKMQGSASMLGRRNYIQRYINRRVQTGFGVDGYPNGWRCINGVDPVTASDEAKECNCYYARDITINQVILAPAPKNQGLAGGVGRINVPRFGCNVTCSVDPNNHSHFNPPGPPEPPKPNPLCKNKKVNPPNSPKMKFVGCSDGGKEQTLEFSWDSLSGDKCVDYLQILMNGTVIVDNILKTKTTHTQTFECDLLVDSNKFSIKSIGFFNQFSTPILFTPSSLNIGCLSPLTPINFKCFNMGWDHITLGWGDNDSSPPRRCTTSYDIQYYEVSQGSNYSTDINVKKQPGIEQSKPILNLKHNTEYTFKIRAKNNVSSQYNPSEWSTIDCKTTKKPHPPTPPPPIPTKAAHFTFSISNYGAPDVFSQGVNSDAEKKFKNYCNSYLNFIYTRGQEIEIDRVLIVIPGNPGPAYNPVNMKKNGYLNNKGDFATKTTSSIDGVNRVAYALTEINGNTATLKSPWVYTYFVKPIIEYNKNNKWQGLNDVIQVGFCLYGGALPADGKGYYNLNTNSGNTDNWTTFIEHNDDLKLPLENLNWNMIANPYGNNFEKNKNNIAQEFAYMREINHLLANDFGPLGNDNPIKMRVSHCTWDQEGNLFPTDEIMNKLWKKYLTDDPESKLPPRWSSTSVNSMQSLLKPKVGPDRFYREIYDLFDYSKPSDAKQVDYICDGTGGGKNGPRIPSDNSYLNIMSGIETPANGTYTLSQKHTPGGWDVIGFAPNLNKPTGDPKIDYACGGIEGSCNNCSENKCPGGVISKKWPYDQPESLLCQNKETCGGGSGSNHRAISSCESLKYNLQVGAGSSGSKYFYAKWVLEDPSKPSSQPFGLLSPGTTEYQKALEYAVRCMTTTGWMNFFGVGRLNNKDWDTYTLKPSAVDGASDGVNLLFSCQSRFNSAGGGTVASTVTGSNTLKECGGEECFGSWKWSEFKFFLDAVVKQLNNLFPGFGEKTHPVHMGLYEFNYLPKQWLSTGPFGNV